jgi:hypothetical protein
MLSKRLVFVLSYAASAMSKGFQGSVDDMPVYPRAKWTVAVYMNGDNNLEQSITGGTAVPHEGLGMLSSPAKRRKTNLPGDFHAELASFGSSDDVHVVALVDRAKGYANNIDDWTNTRIYYVETDDYPDNTRGTYWYIIILIIVKITH